jgi:GGDEF domain-containing protein
MVIIGPLTALPPEADKAVAFATAQAFAESGESADGFYLVGLTGIELEAALHTLRQGPSWDRPIIAGPGTEPHPVMDGVHAWPQAVALVEKASAIRHSLRVDATALRFDERLMYYLYQRDPAELVPVLDRRSEDLYRYPVAELIAQGETEVHPWLSSLGRRGLIEPATLIDRTRHCLRCASAQLHFLDVCPHCASLHIHKGASLHCFTCGHVAPEASFMGDRGLVCPKCQARLRHIGVDYDRPLTQYSCASCHHAFVDTGVLARCLACDTRQKPEELTMREVSTLRLTLKGRAALRAGQLRDSFSALKGVGFAPLEQFLHLVDWAIETQKRHPELAFGLVMLALRNTDELIESHGAEKAYALVDEFARRLAEFIRTSDVTTRTGEGQLWVFLPFTSTEGFLARVKQSLTDLPAVKGPQLSIEVTALSAPRDLQAGEHAEMLMARLQERG